MPIDDGMHPHEVGPASVRRVKVLQVLPVRIGPPSPYKDGAHVGAVCQVDLEAFAHGQHVACDLEVVFLSRGGDKGVDLGEGIWRNDVYGLELFGEAGRLGGAVGCGGGWGVKGACEAGEDGDEEDEAWGRVSKGQSHGESLHD